MRVLVSGGTGFIGSHLVEKLVKNSFDVVVPLRKTSSTRYLPLGTVEAKEAELLDPQDLKGLLKGVDVVFHLASIRGSGWSFKDEEVYDVNVGITRNLLEASVAEGVRQFLYVSSVSIYGHPHGGPIDEEYACFPVTRYGMTKFESERLVKEFKRKEKLHTTIIRPVITYGPRDTWGMIPKLITLIDSKRYLTLGSGKNRVHLIYIDDLTRGLMLAMKNGIAAGKTYILAGQEPIAINSLAGIISSALNKKVPIFHVPIWFALLVGYSMEISHRLFSIDKEPLVTRDKIDIMCRDRCFDVSRAKRDLGFCPTIGYEEGIQNTVDWLKTEKGI
jgi:nucleoside-diphosphate-sugar epimerase